VPQVKLDVLKIAVPATAPVTTPLKKTTVPSARKTCGPASCEGLAPLESDNWTGLCRRGMEG